jgi:hypothetical protein
MLHILDGESSAGTLAQTDVPGEKFAWPEALIEGPAPVGVDQAAWHEIRAQHLTDYYGVDRADADQRLRELEALLQTIDTYDEVVLWFEHDLFCQTNLIFLLNWLALSDTRTKLSLISINSFPGIEDFRGLGQLNPQQLASLFGSRREVTQAQLDTAAVAWAAYCAPHPTTLQELLRTDLSALPFLKRALTLHLARFPSTLNGLGQAENTTLTLIADGLTRFVDLFVNFGGLHPVYGFGDFQLWIALKRLNRGPTPLLKFTNGGENAPFSESQIHRSTIELTAAGKKVVAGQEDFVQLNGIDQWLGGVHLQGKENIWRWDNDAEAVVRM